MAHYNTVDLTHTDGGLLFALGGTGEGITYLMIVVIGGLNIGLAITMLYAIIRELRTMMRASDTNFANRFRASVVKMSRTNSSRSTRSLDSSTAGTPPSESPRSTGAATPRSVELTVNPMRQQAVRQNPVYLAQARNTIKT